MRAAFVRKEVKEEGGKVFTVELSVDSKCRVLELKISGDFFAYPPEYVDYLEREAIGRHVLKLVDLTPRLLSKLVIAGVSREAVESLFKSLVEEVVVRCQEG
ncbi:MAG: hypothetical protein QW780_02165 [Sulfolobales archaeon]